MKRFIIAMALASCFLAMRPANDFLILTIQKFNDYSKANPLVSVHLVLNQNKYVAGDTLFFKAIFLDPELKFVKGKQILEAEVWDENKNVVQQISFRTVDGRAENQIVLSKALKPGRYTLACYSQWMKNFDSKYFFNLTFVIAGRAQFAEEEKLKKPPSISLSPEGGHLVVGVLNNVVVKSSHSGKVAIRDPEGKLVSICVIGTDGFWMGKILPELAGEYYTELEGTKIKLAVAEQNAVALVLPTRGKRESFDLKLLTSPHSLLKDQPLYLIATARNKVTFSSRIQFSERDSLMIRVPARSIEEGLNQIFILDEKGNTLAERIFWEQPAEIKVIVNTIPTIIESRQKASIAVSMSDDLGNPILGEATATMTNNNLFEKSIPFSFTREILLADLPSVKNEIALQGVDSKGWESKSDQYLISAQWERIPWQAIVSENWTKPPNKFKYSQGLQGKATFKRSGESVPDSCKITIYLQKHMIGYDIYTQRDGYFELPFMFDFWGNDNVFYAVEKNGRSLNEVSVDVKNNKNLLPLTNSAKLNEKPEPYGEFMFKKGIVDQSFGFYSNTKIRTATAGMNPNQEFEDELGELDWEIMTKDYIVFPTMEELIHELLSFVKYRKENGGGILRMVLLDAGQNKYSTADPLYIIDGILTKNTAFFLSLKPIDILSVKIVRDKAKLAKLGDIAKNGILLIHTKKELANEVSAATNSFSIEGLSAALPFIVRDYSKANQTRIPDFRSTILWKPSLTLDTSGKIFINYYPSDDIGNTELIIQGISNDGRPFSIVKELALAGKKTIE